MKIQRLLIALTLVNLALLIFTLPQIRPAVAEGVPPVLRGRALEIVDERGRVRASLNVLPAGTQPNGEAYAETVLLRLITERGRPSVKIGASEQAAGVSLAGPTNTKDTYVIFGGERHGQLVEIEKRGWPGADRQAVDMNARKLAAILAAAATGLAVPVAPSQTYPSKPVRLVVPFAAGGTTDTVARLLSQKLPERLGQPVIVENRPGGDSIIGAEAVARAAPDGYTIFLTTSSTIAILPSRGSLEQKTLPCYGKPAFQYALLRPSRSLYTTLPLTMVRTECRSLMRSSGTADWLK